MDIRIGKLRINLSALGLYNHGDNPALSTWINSKLAPVTVYTWDCATQTGQPPKRGPNFIMRTALTFLVTRRLGQEDKLMSGLLADDARKAADLGSLRDFAHGLNRALPPLIVPIDWNTLWAPYKDLYSLRITARVMYLQCLARPYGMQASDYFFILVPHLVTFTTVVTGRCAGGTAADGTALNGWSPHVKPGTVLGELERQIMNEEQEAEERRRRIWAETMEEWGMNPNHAWGFDEDLEPDEEEEGEEGGGEEGNGEEEDD